MVQCRDSRVLAVAVQNDRHQRGSVADGKTTTSRRLDLTCSFPGLRARVCVYMLCAIFWVFVSPLV